MRNTTEQTTNTCVRGSDVPHIDHAIAGAGSHVCAVARPAAAQQILVDRMLVTHERAHTAFAQRAEWTHVPLTQRTIQRYTQTHIHMLINALKFCEKLQLDNRSPPLGANAKPLMVSSCPRNSKFTSVVTHTHNKHNQNKKKKKKKKNKTCLHLCANHTPE